jgi:5-methylcytosine-specific restriction endonuclease McrA
MPIKPENAKLYPKNWPEIRARILERAGHRCEWPGCGVKNHDYGFRSDDGQWHRVTPDTWLAFAAEHTGRKLIRIVLTIAHFPDPDPRNVADENLHAWCQRHHNRADVPHRTMGRTGRYQPRLEGVE